MTITPSCSSVLMSVTPSLLLDTGLVKVVKLSIKLVSERAWHVLCGLSQVNNDTETYIYFNSSYLYLGLFSAHILGIHPCAHIFRYMFVNFLCRNVRLVFYRIAAHKN